jgi:hypothetical protein
MGLGMWRNDPQGGGEGGREGEGEGGREGGKKEISMKCPEQ